MKVQYYLIILFIIIYYIYIYKIDIFRSKHANMIDNNLWIGDIYSSRNRKFITDNNIKLIINCSNNIRFIDIPEIKKIRINVGDNNSIRTNNIMYKNLEPVTNLIEKYLANNKGVLIHCIFGIQRSATIVAAYLMKKYKLNKYDAIKMIKSHRRITFLHYIKYSKLLSKYEKDLSIKN